MTEPVPRFKPSGKREELPQIEEDGAIRASDVRAAIARSNNVLRAFIEAQILRD